MSEHQLDLFNDTEIGRGNVKPGDGILIWYDDRPDPDHADLDCVVNRVDGYGEIGFYVHNGDWEGTLYSAGKPVLKIHHTKKICPVNKFEIIEHEIEETTDTDVSFTDDFIDWDDNIPF